MKTSRGWMYPLPDPFNLLPYYPLDDHSLADMLGVSARTAVRICKGEKRLRVCEVVYLQMLVFGYIPDPAARRGKWHVRHGVLRCHGDDVELSFGELSAWVAMRGNEVLLLQEIAQARGRIRELEEALRVARDELPPNVVRFPAR